MFRDDDNTDKAKWQQIITGAIIGSIIAAPVIIFHQTIIALAMIVISIILMILIARL